MLELFFSFWGSEPNPEETVTIDPLKEIQSLDLSRIRAKAKRRHRWNEGRAAAAEMEYRRFLRLLATNPQDSISPWTDDLDLFWHEHILDTARYDRDCQKIFGHKIHHDPNIEEDPERHATIRNRTQELLAQDRLTEAAAERLQTEPGQTEEPIVERRRHSSTGSSTWIDCGVVHHTHHHHAGDSDGHHHADGTPSDGSGGDGGGDGGSGGDGGAGCSGGGCSSGGCSGGGGCGGGT